MGQRLSRDEAVLAETYTDEDEDEPESAPHALEDAPDFLKSNGNTTARVEESVGILQRATRQRTAGKKLNPPAKVARASPKKRKQGIAAFDMDDEEEGEEGEEIVDQKPATPEPPTPRTTRAAAAAKEATSPYNTRQTRGAQALQSPKANLKHAKWTKNDDKKLLELMDLRVPWGEIQDEMDNYTLTELKIRGTELRDRRIALEEARRQEGAAEEEEHEETEIQAQTSEREDQAKKPEAARAAKAAKGSSAPTTAKHPPASKSMDGGYMRWTTEEEDNLIRKWEAGYGWHNMGRMFPGRSFKALENRYYDLQKAIQLGKRRVPTPEPSRKGPPAKKTKTHGRDFTPEAQPIAQPSTPPSARTRAKTVQSPKDVPTRQPAGAKKRGRRAPEVEQPTIMEAEHDAEDADDESDDHDEPVREGDDYEDPAPEANEEIAESIEGAGEAQQNGDNGDDTYVAADFAGDIEEQESDEYPQEEPRKRVRKKQGGQTESDDDGNAGNAGKNEVVLDSPLPDNVDLYGQNSLLNKIFLEALKFQQDVTNTGTKTQKEYFEERSEHEVSSAVKAIRLHTEKLSKMFDKLTRTKLISRNCRDIDEQLVMLKDRVKHLNPMDAADDERKPFAKQIYMYVFADLIALLKDSLNSYVKKAPSDEQLQLWYLDAFITITFLIKKLHEQTRTWEKMSFHGVGRLRSKVLIPLREVWTAFVKERGAVQEAALAATQSEQDRIARTQERERERELEEEETRMREEWNDKYRRLRGLFIYRQEAAGVLNAQKTRYAMSFKSEEEWRRDIGVPPPQEDSEEEPELDAEGQPFVRENVFVNRRYDQRPPRPSFGHIEEPMEWSEREGLALMRGLKALEGGT